MPFNISLSDITKSLAIIAVVGILYFFGASLLSFFKAPAVVQQPEVIRIDENAIKLAALQASNAMAEKLKVEFKEERSKILAAWEKDKKDTKEKLDELGKVNAKLSQSVNLLKRESDKTYVGKAGKKKLTYDFKIIRAKDAKGEEFPVAWAMYYPNQTPEKRWKTGTYPLEFYTKVIETENPDGSFNRYAEVTLENNQMKETKGKEFSVKLQDIKWAKYERTDKEWFLWNPRLGLSGIFTSDFFAPALDISFSSYGRTKVDMDWRFFILGLGVQDTEESNTDLIFSFSPVQWNFGTKVPLINNAFVGPVIGWSDDGTSYGAVFSIPF